MTDLPKNDDNLSSDTPEVTPAKTTKKTTKKSTKKTTKKTASKKTTKKKTSKRVAKKAAKKTESKTKKVEEVEAETVETDALVDQPTKQVVKTKESVETSRDSSEEQSEVENDQGDQSDDEPTSQRVKRPRGSKKTSQKTTKKTSKKTSSVKAIAPKSQAEMIINYVPGEECRVAMVEDGKLEELMVEPTDRVSRVGNIYVGKVANIEPSIQAVFVDFGTEENGFLHISDLHPQYFAKGDDKTERVGKKTPRKSRPPIQDCLKRGQEIIVQVLKEGVGTKGPTLTSYLSIPGRFLVMMPGMDKVGVSRKEEDDDKRKAAKQILSQLDLPDGFGFILRTAGFDRTKAELKRDLSYLARLWKDMEARRKSGSKPRLLYTESDLLVRSIRDLLTSEVSRVVIDSEPALKRVGRFIKIAAPRSGAKLSHYTGTKPIFHAFGIENQINEIHAREVMLPSGGRLVIDQTEALVAIDVNSGKSRAARDAETNAFKTNIEAVDAICRQLRLRDLGGLVVNDMIDMRFISHRKEVEARFAERLKRDRAKTSTAPISQFGLLEMTRQRMRGSMESQHFADCPMCHGRGLVKRPDSVASTALRDLSALLDYDKVHRAELVVNPRVASSLLSTRRTSLTRIELVSGKTLDVRVSESLPIDRVSFYAYDESGSDIAIEKLKPAKGKASQPNVVEWRDESSPDGSWAMDPLDEVDETTVKKLAEEIAKKAEQAENASLPVEGDLDADSDAQPKKKRRRRRRGGKSQSEESNTESETSESKKDSADQNDSSNSGSSNDNDPVELDENGEPVQKKRRRRRRRGGRGRSENNSEENLDSESNASSGADQDSDTPEANESNDTSSENETVEKRPRRRPRRRPVKGGGAESASNKSTDEESSTKAESTSEKPEADRVTEPKPKTEKRPRRRSRSKATDTKQSESKSEPKASAAKQTDSPKSEKPAKARRGLYSNSRRTLSASELAKLGLE
ncbi:MAG: Rne/Rng family ribonuclease [Phycisphaerales bacterium]|nr:Rne/Rng family ribonuclease [Phycisphaerales bacterium]